MESHVLAHRIHSNYPERFQDSAETDLRMTSDQGHPQDQMQYLARDHLGQQSYPTEVYHQQVNGFEYGPPVLPPSGMYPGNQGPMYGSAGGEDYYYQASYQSDPYGGGGNSAIGRSYESSPRMHPTYSPTSEEDPAFNQQQPSAQGSVGGVGKSASSDKSSLYKTELCRKFTQTGFCRYGDKCQFAHGYDELRATIKHPLYKTTPCKSFQASGVCRYGNRCRFIHDESEFELANVPRGVPAQNLSVDTASGKTTLVPVGSFPSPGLSPQPAQSYPAGRQPRSPAHSPAHQPTPRQSAFHRVPSAPANMSLHSHSVPDRLASSFSSLSLLGHETRGPVGSHSFQALETHVEHLGARAGAGSQLRDSRHRVHSASTQNLSSFGSQSQHVSRSPLPRAPLVGKGMTSSASFSERILPSFCLPMAPKIGFARQSSMSGISSMGREPISVDTGLEATAKAFGRPSLDLNSSTFSPSETRLGHLDQVDLNRSADEVNRERVRSDEARKGLWDTVLKAPSSDWDNPPSPTASASDPSSLPGVTHRSLGPDF